MAVVTYRVSNGFATLSDGDLDTFAANVVLKTNGNPAFPNSPVPPLVLAAKYNAFHIAQLAAQDGGSQLLAVRDETRDDLTVALRQVGAYVQSVAGQALSILLTSGFETVSTNRAQFPLDTPVIIAIDNSMSTQFNLKLQPVANAKTYQVQKCVVGGPWQEAAFSTQARSILVTGLTPGTIYSLQTRAIGGSTGNSGWSIPGSCMAT